MGKKLAKLNIYSVFDLLYHIPFRYEDRSLISTIREVQPGETVTIIANLDSIKNAYTRRGKIIQQASISDSSGSIPIIWFNQPYLLRSLKPGQQLSFYGKINFFGRAKTLISPEYETLPTTKIVPIYPETAGISSKWLRSKIHSLLNQLPSVNYLHLDSLSPIHFPTSLDQVPPAHHNLALDELFLLQLSALLHRKSWQQTRLTHAFSIDQEKVAQLISSLPFTLTPSQNSTIKQILSDLSKSTPMNRLLEGDVGSGKTVVAAIASYVAYLNGHQTILMAPTQILAQQHFNTLKNILNIPIALVTSNKKINLDSNILVGTHAILSGKLQLNKVGLVIIDEQHRFGVAQRALAANIGSSPHVLTMTATPIPRTIALTLYGDLDLSTLDTIPNRQLIKTWIVPEEKRDSAYNWIKSQKTQVFIVCPFIQESESLQSVKAVKIEFEKLKQIFSDFKLGLLHGKLKSKEKDEVIGKFRTGEYNILVSTPIIEVGIDIPTASIMLIEGADRFGLAQLHQLRGRVGRGQAQSYCLLFANKDTARLKALEKHASGAELAEIDLKLRGAGNIFGTAQHGIPQFKIANYDDFDLIQTAKNQAASVLPQLDKHPLLRTLLEKDKISSYDTPT